MKFNSVSFGLLVATTLVLRPACAHAQASLHTPDFAQALVRHVVDRQIDFVGLREDAHWKAYLEGIARFDVSRLKVNVADEATAEEKKDAAEYERASRLAFWINAFNALMLKAIADRYDGKLQSVRQIGNLMSRPIAEVAGKSRSLREIEDEILRKQLKDPRVVFLLYRGTLGGPRLPALPVSASRLEAEIQTAAEELFNRKPPVHRVDTIGCIVWLPDFMQLYDKDFGGGPRTARAVSRFFSRERERRFVELEECEARYWSSDSALEVKKPRAEPKK